MLRILIVDENSPFRESLQVLLHDRFPDAVIEVVDTCEDAEKKIVVLSPGIAFLNIHLTDGKALEWARGVKQRYPAIMIMALADNDLPEYHVASRRSGVDFFVPKDQWSGGKMLALVESMLMNGQAAPQGA